MRNLLWLCALAASLFAAPAEARDELNLFNWNNYISDATVARFEQSCNCKLVQDYYSDNEEMLAKLAAGASGYDLIVPTGNAVESLIKSQQLRPIDKALLPNLKNIDPAYLNTAFDPGNRYSVPTFLCAFAAMAVHTAAFEQRQNLGGKADRRPAGCSPGTGRISCSRSRSICRHSRGSISRRLCG